MDTPAIDDLPGPDYTDLLGVPAATLARLRALEQAAEACTLGYRQWCADVDAALAGFDLPSSEELDTLGRAVIKSAFGDMKDKARVEHRLALGRYLRCLAGPPSVEQIRADLADLPTRGQRILARETGDDRRELAEVLRERELCLQTWLHDADPTQPAPTVYDEETGLPLSTVEAYRTATDEVLGDVPVSWKEARGQAYEAATAEEKAAADRRAEPWTFDDGHWRRIGTLMKTAQREAVVSFLKFVHEHDSDTGRQVRGLWDDGDLRDLFAEHLDQQ